MIPKKKIVIVFGDPNSINSEIIFKTWKKLNQLIRKKICVIGNYNLIKKQLDKLGYYLKLNKLKNINDDIDHKMLNIINVNLNFKNPFKVSIKHSSAFVKESLDLAHFLSTKNHINGFINCPINKTILKNGQGVTEYLAKKCDTEKDTEVMLIRNKKLSVIPITTHIDINKISNKITPLLIKKKINTFDKWFKKTYNRKPKIAILGLNPHNAELKKNSKEFKVIKPTINQLKKKGLKLTGPLAADTVFIENYKNYDVVIGMYHDQVLTPLKALFKFEAINITLGLKYFRASPDHGVAIDLIKKNKANPISLIHCVDFFNKLKK